jgi:hypothetical protein
MNYPYTLSSRATLRGWQSEELDINGSVDKNLNI